MSFYYYLKLKYLKKKSIDNFIIVNLINKYIYNDNKK